MKTIRSLLIGIFLLSVCFPLIGQENFQLSTNWELSLEKDSSEKINKMITSFNGYIIAVGESVSKKSKDSNGLFMVIDPKDGKRINWKQFGGSGRDVFNSIVQNFDGTFTLVGHSNSNGNSAAWLVRVNQEGQMLNEATAPKQKSAKEEIIDVAINSNGSVMVVGMQYLNKKPSVWVMNMNKELYGEKKKITIKDVDQVKAICAGSDGQFVMVGNTVNKSRNYKSDAWAMKVDELGNDLWNGGKYFGDNGLQNANGISYSAQNEGYVITGCNTSSSAGKRDMWILKINEKGTVQWEKLLGGYEEDIAHSIIEISEGRYAIAGQTKSHMSNAKYAALQIIITDMHGNQLSERIETIYAANGDNIAHSIIELFGAENIVLAASTKPEKLRENPIPFVGAYTYRIRPNLGDKNRLDKNAVSLTTAQFVDDNEDGFWAAGERGFAYLDISNRTVNSIYNVRGSLVGDNIASMLKSPKQIILGTINAHQTRRLVIPIQAKKPLKEDLRIRIVIESEEGGLGQTETALSSIKREPARLEIGQSNFSPKVTKTGEIVKLQVELTNKGGISTPIVPVEFNLPMGVIPQSAEQLSLPRIDPGESKTVDFSFVYGPDYQRDNINVLFKTKKVAQVEAIDKTFTLSFDKVHKGETKNPNNMVLVLAKPDLSNHREVIDVHRNIAEIKVITVSSKRLVKSKFAARINGVRHQGQKMDKSSLSPGTSDGQGKIQQSFSTFVKLKPGLNLVDIVYLDDDDQTSIGQIQQISFNYIPPENPSLWVISIGVAHDDLKYTIKDAKDFASIYEGLKSANGHGFKKVEVRKLLQKKETNKLSLQKTFQDFRQEAIKDGDLVIVFISSHGKISSQKKNKFLLLPSDFDSRYEDFTSIDFEDDILNQLRPMKGNKLVFIDACHSGAIGARLFDDKATSKVMSDLIESTKGLEIFASCSSSEQSYESESWDNGAFTKAILEAFKDSKVEVNGRVIHSDIYREHSTISGELERGSDGVITIRELKEFIEQRIPYLVRTNKGKPQNPKVWRDFNMDHNTGIFMVY